MATSTVREPRLRFFLRFAASSATAPAAPDSSSPRRVIGWSCGPIRGREASIAPPMLDALREEVAAASRRLAADGLVLGTAGNLSAREGEQVAITPTGAHLSKLDADQVCVIDLDGALLQGDYAPTSERELHLGVYRKYRAGAVVHTHSPMATALSCVLDELPCVHYGLLALGGSVRVAPYETFGTSELAKAVLDALDGKTAALMANHGAIAYGADMATAGDGAELLEWGCGVYWHAAALGKPRTLDDEQQAAVVTAAVERSYGGLKKR